MVFVKTSAGGMLSSKTPECSTRDFLCEGSASGLASPGRVGARADEEEEGPRDVGGLLGGPSRPARVPTDPSSSASVSSFSGAVRRRPSETAGKTGKSGNSRRLAASSPGTAARSPLRSGSAGASGSRTRSRSGGTSSRSRGPSCRRSWKTVSLFTRSSPAFRRDSKSSG